MSIVLGIIVLYVVLGSVVKALLHPAKPEPPASYPLQNLREITAAAKREADAAGDLEELLTDLQEVNADILKYVTITWAGTDGTHTERIVCSGGSETDALYHIAAKQLIEHKEALASLSSEMALRAGRRAQNGAQNGSDRWGRGL